MKDLELALLPAWRYCNIPRGQKGPRSAGWQRQHHTLAEIDPAGNVGVILGPASGGVAALDFDGPSAWLWWDQEIGIEIPATVSWASGKPGRCQMAFEIPEPYWDHIRTLKIATGDREGFEFRWSGGQSVVPPSLHPDTQQEYFWVRPPSHGPVVHIPDAVLARWLIRCNPEPAVVRDTYTERPPNNDQVVAIYEQLKQCYPTLDFDRWSRATWAISREIGQAAGVDVMKYFWPEQTAGEYSQLFVSSYKGRPTTLGTIVEWIRERRPEYLRGRQDRHRAEYERYCEQQQQIAQIEQIIQRKKRNE
jgi:hypothetical protein